MVLEFDFVQNYNQLFISTLRIQILIQIPPIECLCDCEVYLVWISYGFIPSLVCLLLPYYLVLGPGSPMSVIITLHQNNSEMDGGWHQLCLLLDIQNINYHN